MNIAQCATHHPYISTATGEKIYFEDFDPCLLNIENLARALSREPRYLLAANRFYSVAQHSVLVSQVCELADARHGVLHDASEALMRDLPSGLKRLPELAGYRAIEAEVQAGIYQRWGLHPAQPPSVKVADRRVAATEALSFLDFFPEWIYKDGYDPIENLAIFPLSARAAEKAFLRRFAELFGAQ